MKSQRNIILITGASSGIGKITAEYLTEKGYTVYGTSRKPEKTPDITKFTLLKLDVCDDASVKEAVQTVLNKEGRIDVLINNAGFGLGGSIEATSVKDMIRQVDTNFFGTYRMAHDVIPEMRKQGSGLIINLSSIGGVIGLPYQGIYSASKFAVEGYSEALYKELYKTGIRVAMIEPGDFQTGFTAQRELIGEDENFKRSLAVIEHDENNGQKPIKIAKLIEKIIKKDRPKLRYPVGAFDQKLSIFLKKTLPNKLFDKIIMGYYKVK